MLICLGAGPPEKDNPFRPESSNLLDTKIERVDFAIDVGFADAPRDELSVLGAKIENEDHSAL